jgi:DNA-binding MarR family transcriptional regulator
VNQPELFEVGESVSPASLTPAEAIAYRMIYDAAEAGEPCPMNIDIEIEIGASSSSMGPKTVARLEAKGLIRVARHHRARIVTIAATGKETACPSDQRTDLPRRDRGTHSDGPLLTALAELGVPEQVADLMLGGLPALGKLDRLLDRAKECVARRRNGYLLGDR